MGQLVDEVKSQFKGINFIVVHTEDEAELPIVEDYDIQIVPTTFLFDKNGTERERFSGVVDKGVLTQKLKDLTD